MGIKATHKDFYMEIKKSFGRFMSIFLIVALGVAFFSGIRAAEPAMRKTGDSYFDKSKLMDIKAISTLGITEEDIDAFAAVDGVERAEGAYSADFLCGEEQNQSSVHVMSFSPTMNKLTVSKGRLPEKKGECIVDDELGFKVGDKIILKSGDGSAVTDTLKTDTLTVVGQGNSPFYISFGRGSTTIGTGSLSGFVAVTESSFALDTYTEAYIEVAGARALTAYTDEYDDRVSAVMKHVKKEAKERGVLRKQEVIADAESELDDAKQELADGKAKADSELADAAQTLADGEEQLSAAKTKLADGRTQITAAKTTLKSKQEELNNATVQYESGKQQLEDGWSSYNQGKTDYDQQMSSFLQQQQQSAAAFQEQRKQLDQLSADCTLLEQQISAVPAPPNKDELENQLKIMKDQLAAGEQQYQSEKTNADNKLAEAKAQLDAGGTALANSEAQLNASQTQLADALSQIQSGQSQIDAGWRELKTQEATLKDGEEELSVKETELNDGKQQYEEAKAKAEKELSDGQQKITDAEREIKKIKDPKWYINDRGTLPEHTSFGENADRMRAIGQVFPIVFFLVAALISLTTMTRMVEEQRVEIGTMKALGYSRKTIALKYVGYALLATMGGSIFGVLFGEKVLPYIIIYAYQIMYLHLPEIIVPYHWGYAAAATLAAVACTMAATISACFRELSDQPAVLMRPPAPKKGTRVFLEHVPFIWKHLSFIWKSTIRNLMRYKKRFFMTIIGIGGCMALMLVGFGLKDSILNIAGLQYGQIQTYDGMAYLEDDITEKERTDLQTFLDDNQSIQRYMDVNMKNITLVNGKNEREAYQCIPATPEKMSQYVNFKSRTSKDTYKLTDEGAILSEKTAKLLDAGIGDTIYVKDEENGNMPVKITAICENYMGHYIYFTPKVYKSIYGEDVDYNCIYYKADKTSKAGLEKVGQKILAEDGVLNVSYLHDIQKQLDDMLKSLNMVIGVLIISAGMLAFVVLYNLNNVNITERQRELATIKVLGFYDPELAAYVYRENILLTLIGACVGMGLGRLLHLFVISTVEVDNVMFGRNINFPSYLYSFLFTIAFSAIVNWVMYFKLKKIDMVESLKSIE